MNTRTLRAALLVVVACAGSAAALADVKVRTYVDDTFDFTRARTWAWDAVPGSIVLARTQQDDPALVKQRAEPVIFETVDLELPKRGLTKAQAAPDVTLIYYLLLTLGASDQRLGQFLPTMATWGLPRFRPATTSLEVVEQGALALDVNAQGRVVWRGVADAKIKMDMPLERRTQLLREAVQEILKRFPPK